MIDVALPHSLADAFVREGGHSEPRMHNPYAPGLIREHFMGGVDAEAICFIVRCRISGFCDAALKDRLMNFPHVIGM